MSSEPVVVLVKYRALPGKERVAAEALSALVATVVAVESQCHGITILQESGEPGTVLLVEHWTDREAFVGPHMQQPHIQAFMQRAGDLFSGRPDISFWHSAVGA